MMNFLYGWALGGFAVWWIFITYLKDNNTLAFEGIVRTRYYRVTFWGGPIMWGLFLWALEYQLELAFKRWAKAPVERALLQEKEYWSSWNQDMERRLLVCEFLLTMEALRAKYATETEAEEDYILLEEEVC